MKCKDLVNIIKRDRRSGEILDNMEAFLKNPTVSEVSERLINNGEINKDDLGVAAYVYAMSKYDKLGDISKIAHMYNSTVDNVISSSPGVKNLFHEGLSASNMFSGDMYFCCLVGLAYMNRGISHQIEPYRAQLTDSSSLLQNSNDQLNDLKAEISGL